jgi:hypothetical protein
MLGHDLIFRCCASSANTSGSLIAAEKSSVGFFV